MKNVGYGLLALIILISLSWLVQGNDWFMFKIFAPRYEQVRRETFEQSKAYNQGMIQELQNMRFEYERTTDPKSKEAMAAIILHRVADYDRDKLPEDLKSFIYSLENKTEVSK